MNPFAGRNFLILPPLFIGQERKKGGESSAPTGYRNTGERDIPEKGNAGLASQGKDITPLNHRRNPPPVMTTFICSRMIPVGSLLYS